jgi:nucleoside-diphosphate-sugar epimerase
MRVMVLGASGFIGPAVLRRLAARGHEPVAVSRTEAGAVGAFRHLRADRTDAAAIGRLCDELAPDAVVDMQAMTLAATEPLLDALAGRIGRYVLASSGDVYRQYDALHRKAHVDPAAAPLAEDAPLRTRLHPYRGPEPRAAHDPQAWLDDYDKIPIERALRARLGLGDVVVRLPMVWGPGDRQRRFAWAIRPMAAGAAVVEVDAAWAAWRTTYGYVEDVGEGLALAAVHPAAGGQTFNLGDAAAPDHLAWAARWAQALNWRGEVRTVPREALPAMQQVRLDALDLSVPLVTDTGRIRRELDYVEVTPPAEAFAATAADELSRAA